MAFDTNVFINCPFDDDYAPLLRPLLFTIVHLGLTPRIALEAMDSGTLRLSKIVTLIRESRYAVHDLSRIQASKKGEFYRMNMPFELGIDLGAREFGLPAKRCLVLEARRFDYQRALSDLAGCDISHHEGKPEEVVRVIRNWLRSAGACASAPGPSGIWNAFNVFASDLQADLEADGHSPDDIKRLPVDELTQHMINWVEAHKPATD